MKHPGLVKLIIVLVIGLLFLFSIFFVLNKKSPSVLPTAQNFSTITIPGKDQQPITVKDIRQSPVEKVQDTYVLANTDFYSLVYYAKDSSFTIVLSSSPLQFARSQAELELLNDLKISQAQACQLKLMVNVPYEVSQSNSGRDLGLSFCPNSLSLQP